MNPRFINAEFHCHTRYSPDSLMSIEALLLACRKKGIDKVAVTTTTAEAREGHEMLQPGHLGEESDQQGEILAYF
jgi:histidinol phosphatase-like PHP family hydrolase